MYNLFYWVYDAKLMCTFDNYADCKKALQTLEKKYPKAKIWIQRVIPISSFEEWEDKFNSSIQEY